VTGSGPGKLTIMPTKRLASQSDLSLAYSPGVAAPCEEIAADPSTAARSRRRTVISFLSSVVFRFFSVSSVLSVLLSHDDWIYRIQMMNLYFFTIFTRVGRRPCRGALYTARQNIVAVITNGTAVLGLGDIGALASKPVMEGKAAGLHKLS
jgi:malic enzyme